MDHKAEIKDFLVGNAIHLIAVGGFEKATTKNLAYGGEFEPDFKMNEVYIYRLFGSKEALYESAFACLDTELFESFRAGIKEIGNLEEHTKEKLHAFFLKSWNFILGDEERCRCYIRYYYSIYFKKSSRDTHRKHFMEIVRELTPLFKEEADVPAILHSVFTALFDFAIRVHNGELEDNEINRPHIFNVLYCMMMTYFRDDISKENGLMLII